MKAATIFFALLILAFALPETTMSVTTRDPHHRISIIPQPLSIEQREGSFSVTAKTVIAAPSELAFTAEYLQGILKRSTGFRLSIIPLSKAPSRGAIVLSVSPEAGPGDEAYTADVSPAAARLTGAGVRGAMYAVQTFLQLLPPPGVW